METSPTPEEIKANALRFAGNAARRYKTYVRRYMKKYGKTVRTPPSIESFFENRIYEDTYAKAEDLLGAGGKKIETRQELADPMMVFRATLEDPSKFDEIYAESLARRMSGRAVTVSKAMSASPKVHEKDSIRTFVTKAVTKAQ